LWRVYACLDLVFPAFSQFWAAGVPSVQRFKTVKQNEEICFSHHRNRWHTAWGGTLWVLLNIRTRPTCTVSESLVSAPQSVSDHQVQLCDSVRPASPQVSGHPLHNSESSRCPCLACGDRSPTGEGRDRAGPSSSRWGQGTTVPTSLYPRKVVGYDQSWTCEVWIVDSVPSCLHESHGEGSCSHEVKSSTHIRSALQSCSV